MNKENVQYLTDNIKYMGFGDNHAADLERQIGAGKPEFQLQFKAVINQKPFAATLNFKKSDSTDMYFFNNYKASLEKGNGAKAEQTFYINKGKGVTAKEAYNLLDGRAVHKDLTNKENEPYKAWVQLDLRGKDKNNNYEMKQYHENYGFDLKAAVSKFAVAEMKDPDKEKMLLQSLQKGNLQSVTIEKDGASQKMFMEANPQFKTMNLYDGQMKRVQKEELEKYQSAGKEVQPATKQETKQEAIADVKKNNKNTLLPKKPAGTGIIEKKRTSAKKGLSV